MTAGKRPATLQELFIEGRRLLEPAALAAGSDAAREASLLLESAAGLERGGLHLYGQEEADEGEIHRFFALCLRRAAGEPLQYLVGQWEFYSLPFYVGEGVLIPRPETELLVETGLELIVPTNSPKVADLCSGSGCVAVAIAHTRPDARVWAAEASAQALGYLYRNLELNLLEGRIQVVEGDVLSPLAFAEEELDLILSNPPYIPQGELPALQTEVQREPAMALDGGEDGLEFYRAIPRLYHPLLRRGGALAMEIGSGQEQDVQALFAQSGYREVQCRRDLAGLPRVVLGYK